MGIICFESLRPLVLLGLDGDNGGLVVVEMVELLRECVGERGVVVVAAAADVLITVGVVLTAEEVRDGGGDRGWREFGLVDDVVVVTTVGRFALPPLRLPPAAVATEGEPGMFSVSPDSEGGRTILASTFDLI